MPYLPYQYPHTATKHFVTPLMAMGLGTLVEPASAQRSTGSQKLNGTGSRASSHSRSFLLNHHYTWKAGNTIGAAMPRRGLVIGVVFMILSAFSRPLLTAPDWSTPPLGGSVATLVRSSGLALASDGHYVDEANTSQVGELI